MFRRICLLFLLVETPPIQGSSLEFSHINLISQVHLPPLILLRALSSCLSEAFTFPRNFSVVFMRWGQRCFWFFPNRPCPFFLLKYSPRQRSGSTKQTLSGPTFCFLTQPREAGVSPPLIFTDNNLSLAFSPVRISPPLLSLVEGLLYCPFFLLTGFRCPRPESLSLKPPALPFSRNSLSLSSWIFSFSLLFLFTRGSGVIPISPQTFSFL